MRRDLQELIDIVETWQARRQPLAVAFSQDGMREFIETHNALTRRLIAVTEKKDPEFWSSFLELAQNASTLVSGGKIFVNGQDRTNT